MSCYIVSKCLYGYNCKYSGGNNNSEKVKEYCKNHEVVLVCPECFGGLSIPREPSEIRVCGEDRYVFSQSGEDVTVAFVKGAEKVLETAQNHNAELCILKEGSPSCGVHKIYDGTFCGVKIPGMGFTAKLLAENGFKVISEDDILQ